MPFIFPSGETVVTSSEYNSTALVLASYAGSGELAAACIHAGASASAHFGNVNSPIPQTTKKHVFSFRFMNASIARGRSAGLQNHLLLILGFHELIEIAENRIVLLADHKQLGAQDPLHVHRAVPVFNLQRILNGLSVLIHARRQGFHLPAMWQLESEIIQGAKRVAKVDWPHTIRVLEQVLFRRAEKSGRQERASASGSCPPRHFQLKFRHERTVAGLPIRSIREFHFTASWNCVLHSVLEYFLSGRLVFIALLNAQSQGVQSRYRDGQFSGDVPVVGNG